MKHNRYLVNRKLWGFANKISEYDNEISNRNIMIRQAYNPVQAVTIDGLPHGSDVSDTTQSTVLLIERYQREKLRYIEAKERTLAEFEQYIGGLREQVKAVLRLRYLKARKPLQTAIQLGYSEVHVKRLLAEAQDKLET